MAASSAAFTDGAAATERPAASANARAGRVAFIDALRLLAAVQMVQGHTIDAVLDRAYRHGAVHALWSQARGLTSVAFLFAAGLAYARVALTKPARAGDAAHRMRRVL